MMRTSLVSAGLALGASLTVQTNDAVVLIQQKAQPVLGTSEKQTETAMEEEWVSGFGSTVPLTETGYQTVAALKDDHQMKAFIRRAVQKEARYVKNFGELNGAVPFYSGSQEVQSFEALQREIRSAAWVGEGEGRTAPLNDAGYQKVAKLKSKPNMIAYARRLLDADGKKCVDEGALAGLVSYFDGEISVQDFAHLRQELLAAPWAVARAGIALLQEEAQPAALAEELLEVSSNSSSEWSPMAALKKLIPTGGNSKESKNLVGVSDEPLEEERVEERSLLPCCLGLQLAREDDDEHSGVMGLNMETCKPYQNTGTNAQAALWKVDMDRAGRVSLKSKEPSCGFLEVVDSEDGSETIDAKTKDRSKERSKWEVTFFGQPQHPGDDLTIALGMHHHYLSRNIIPDMDTGLALGFDFVHNAVHAELPYEARFHVLPLKCPGDEEVKYEQCFSPSPNLEEPER